MTLKVGKGNGNQDPNTWEKWNAGTPEEAIIYICPNGQPLGLVMPESNHNWAISADGKVSPSVYCSGNLNRPGICKNCNFHEFLELEGWDGK